MLTTRSRIRCKVMLDTRLAGSVPSHLLNVSKDEVFQNLVSGDGRFLELLSYTVDQCLVLAFVLNHSLAIVRSLWYVSAHNSEFIMLKRSPYDPDLFQPA